MSIYQQRCNRMRNNWNSILCTWCSSVPCSAGIISQTISSILFIRPYKIQVSRCFKHEYLHTFTCWKHAMNRILCTRFYSKLLYYTTDVRNIVYSSVYLKQNKKKNINRNVTPRRHTHHCRSEKSVPCGPPNVYNDRYT